ncbi:MAG: dTMP kinase [Alphaproteobacteria bacterium]|nr:dTMP kinase [Alphaproteobacteria bacterium]
MRGRLITIEGGEGAGKSTQIGTLVAALAAAGIEALRTREPGGAPGAEAIRALLVNGGTDRWDPVTETLLHYAARREHVVRLIQPALARGAWVVSDRFADSTMAYQSYAQGVPRTQVEAIHAAALGAMRPDLTLLLDLPVAVGLARAGARGATNRYERFDADFHERVRAGFLDIARREPERCAVIDATAAPELVHAAILAAVTARLGVALRPAAIAASPT